MKRLLTFALAATALPAAAQDAAPSVTPASIVAAAPPEHWQPIDPADLLVMTLTPDAAGQSRVVTIQLMPRPFSEGWVDNIRTLAKGHWWDGTSVYRVVENWVTQWGDGEDDPAKAKPLPDGVVSPILQSDDYAETSTCLYSQSDGQHGAMPCPSTWASLVDPYVPGGKTGFLQGWPAAFRSEDFGSREWPIHCYGYVGVARDLAPDTGTGAELYAVIGHAPRQLDRNIAVVGRVIEGIEHLSTLPRGKGEAGVYDDPALRVPVVSVRLGDELPEAPRFEYLDTESASFARYLEVSANRDDPFYRVPAGGIDICNARVPIRRAP